MGKLNDLAGQTFGALEVIERAGADDLKRALWRCICHRCGQEAIIPGVRLTSKRPLRDCGCSYRVRTADITGQQHGGLMVLHQLDSINQNKVYLCRCSACGQEKPMFRSSILENPATCGCGKVVNGASPALALREKANRNNKLGIRGVCYIPAKRYYAAHCVVAGERWKKTGFPTAESAKAARDAAHAVLIEKHGIKKP